MIMLNKKIHCHCQRQLYLGVTKYIQLQPEILHSLNLTGRTYYTVFCRKSTPSLPFPHHEMGHI